ncbi:hypothetical protein ANTPLA_LOCUS3230 [Anthophora plagiata]
MYFHRPGCTPCSGKKGGKIGTRKKSRDMVREEMRAIGFGARVCCPREEGEVSRPEGDARVRSSVGLRFVVGGDHIGGKAQEREERGRITYHLRGLVERLR